MKLLKTCIGLALTTSALAFTSTTRADAGQSMGIIVLSPNAQGALKLTGQAHAVIPQVRVNSSGTQSIKGSGSVILDSPDAATVGGCSMGGGAQCTSQIVLGAGATADPFGALPAPPFNPTADLGSRSINGGNVTLQPGYYSGGIKVSGGNVTLNSGIYILDGEGLKLTGTGAHVTAAGALIYLRGAGALTLGGGATLQLSPLTSGSYEGISLFQDHADTATASITGNGGIDVSGTLYLPAAALSVSGTGQVAGQGPMIGGFVIAKTIDISGTGEIKIGAKPVLPTPEMMYD